MGCEFYWKRKVTRNINEEGYDEVERDLAEAKARNEAEALAIY